MDEACKQVHNWDKEQPLVSAGIVQKCAKVDREESRYFKTINNNAGEDIAVSPATSVLVKLCSLK
jgi:hypothetical protein